jgi:formylglycine-generating enzyme required for sulfatase activity
MDAVYSICHMPMPGIAGTVSAQGAYVMKTCLDQGRLPQSFRHQSGRVFGIIAVSLVCLVFSGVGDGSAYAADPPEMIRIPGGSFTMGRDDGPEDEGPAHRVMLAPFLIDRLPVTNAEFADFLNAAGGPMGEDGRRLFDWDDGDARIHKQGNAYRADSGFADRPVVEPSWPGALAYCRWKGKRLPTEAEWERAAKGTEGRPYPWGHAAPDASRAQFGSGWGETVPVGTPAAGATPEGVKNLAGNVHEWVSSLYWPYPYRARDGREDPDASGERVTRGGAADTGAETLRTTWRGRGVSRNPRSGHHNIGFRCAKSAPVS